MPLIWVFTETSIFFLLQNEDEEEYYFRLLLVHGDFMIAERHLYEQQRALVQERLNM